MTLSLLPVLCSLLVSGSPRADELVVHVRDAGRTPLAGIAVRVLGVERPDMRSAGWETFFAELARATTDEQGAVSFECGRLHDRLPSGSYLRVEPCVPTLDALGVEFPSGTRPTAPIAFELPPLARIEFELPSRPDARVRLLRAFTEHDDAARANERVAGLAWTLDPRGAAVLPHVGLGLQFEAALAMDGLMGEVVFTCAGPTRAGETIRVPDPSLGRLLEFEGRALDERGTPLAHTTLTAQTWEGHASEFTGAGCDLISDAEGRFRVETCAPGNTPNTPRLGLRIACTPLATGVRVAALVRVDSPTRPGRRALGDVRFAPDTVELTLATYSDADLESELRLWVASRSRTVGSHQDWVELLTEVVRRGGPSWTKIVEELAASRLAENALAARKRCEAESEHDDPDTGPEPVAHDRRLLTALRQLQGRPNPVVLEVLRGPAFEHRFPALPRIECRLRNVDLTERVRVEFRMLRDCVLVYATDPITAAGLERFPTSVIQRGPSNLDTTLAPGSHVLFSIDLAEHARLHAPGSHELRFALEEDRAPSSGSIARPFALRSTPFIVKLDADAIRLTRPEYEALRAELMRIPRDSCVKLVRAPWTSDTRFILEDLEPQDRIFRAGWRALPVLIDALDDPRVEPRHEEWALGLLFDLSGLHQPADGEGRSVIGRVCWENAWPTTRRDIVSHDLRGNGFHLPEGRTAEHLKAAWKALRANLDVVIE